MFVSQGITVRKAEMVPLDFVEPTLPPLMVSTVDKIEELLRRANFEAQRKGQQVTVAKRNASSAANALNATVQANERSEAAARSSPRHCCAAACPGPSFPFHGMVTSVAQAPSTTRSRPPPASFFTLLLSLQPRSCTPTRRAARPSSVPCADVAWPVPRCRRCGR